MNDEELGRALGTALAPPAVAAVPDAGARLRSRARRVRTERLALGGTVVVVLAVLLTVGLVRGVGGTAPAPAAAPAPGYRKLATPLTIALRQPLVSKPANCAGELPLRCVTPASILTVDRVLGVSSSDLPESGAVVEIDLFSADEAAIAGAGERMLVARVGAAEYPVTLDGRGGLRILVLTPRLGAELIDELGPYRPPPPRLGPGRLDVPLQLWAVTRSAEQPCAVSAAARDVIVAQQQSECLVLTGPGVSLTSADLRLLPPEADQPYWRVAVGLDPADRPALAAFTRAQAGRQIAYVISGRMLTATGAPTVQGEFSTGLEIVFADGRADAEAFIDRLRR